MSKELTAQQQFMEKISERLRKDIGDLLPDDVLSELVQKNIDEIFMQDKKKITPRQYGSDIVEFSPSDFRVLVKEIAEPIVTKVIEQYFADNKKLLETMTYDYIKESIPVLIRDAISSCFSDVGRDCLLYTSPSPRDGLLSRMPSSA